MSCRRDLRFWVLMTYGDGSTVPCATCDAVLNCVTMTLDRYPLPGKHGGGYTRDNVRPQCVDCNTSHKFEPSDFHLGEFAYRPFEGLMAA